MCTPTVRIVARSSGSSCDRLDRPSPPRPRGSARRAGRRNRFPPSPDQEFLRVDPAVQRAADVGPVLAWGADEGRCVPGTERGCHFSPAYNPNVSQGGRPMSPKAATQFQQCCHPERSDAIRPCRDICPGRSPPQALDTPQENCDANLTTVQTERERAPLPRIVSRWVWRLWRSPSPARVRRGARRFDLAGQSDFGNCPCERSSPEPEATSERPRHPCHFPVWVRCSSGPEVGLDAGADTTLSPELRTGARPELARHGCIRPAASRGHCQEHFREFHT